MVPLTAELSRVHLTVSRQLLAKLDAARDAHSHASADAIIEAGLDLLLDRAAKRRGLVEKPRKTPPPSSGDAIPAHVKREVWEREGARLTPTHRAREAVPVTMPDRAPAPAPRLATATPRPALAAVGLTLALALAGCGSDPTSKPAAAAEGWIDVPGMTCADGSGTGIWISRGASENVLVILSGGGACWASDRCDTRPWYLGGVPRAFGQTDFAVLQAGNGLAGTLADRTVPGHPFASWTHVYVPYCTGDVHAGGDVRRTYGSLAWRHHGYANLQAAVARIAQELPRPPKVVVSGFSAGGFGSLLALDLVHAAWDPGAATSLDASLVDDSGQTFGPAQLPGTLLTAWWDGWGLGSTLGALCPGCATDLSQAWDVLHQRHPADRLALLSTTQDAVMRGFFGTTATTPMDSTTFANGLAVLCGKLGAAGFDHRAACFETSGNGHAMFWEPESYVTSLSPPGVTLLSWLGKLAAGDPTWASVGP